MNKKVKKSTKIDYKVVSFILFTIGFFAIFAVRPSVSLIFNLQHEKAEYERIDRVLEEKIQKIIATQSQFMELVNNKDLVEEALPATHKIEKTKEFLKLDLAVGSFAVQKVRILPKTQPGLNKVVFNLSGTADYRNLLALLRYIDSSRRLMTMDFLTIAVDPHGSGSASLNFSTILHTYYFLDI